MSGYLKCSACGYVVYPQEQETCGALERNGYHWCKGELRDSREQARLARIQEQSRKLSLAECVYWLTVAGELGQHVLERIAQRDAREVRAVARTRLQEARHHRRAFNNAVNVNYADIHAELWRKRTARARLLLEAAKRIREEKRIREKKP
jgi:hypothetical protein